MKHIARATELDEFIEIVHSGSNIQKYCAENGLQSSSCAEYDRYHIYANKSYGLLTNYMLYFLNPQKLSEPDDVFEFIDTHIHLLRTENLESDVQELIEQHNIPHNPNAITKKYNVSEKPAILSISDKSKTLIRSCERHIFEHYYQHALSV